MKLLLIAKPWRGGLARYLWQALNALFPGNVEWLPTYPASLPERIAYKRDRSAWRNRILERVDTTNCDAVIFINHFSDIEALGPRNHFRLWLTDDPRPIVRRSSIYGRVYITDPGYKKEVSANLGGGRFGGVLPFGYLPELHRPRGDEMGGRGFCFIGNRDPKRDFYFRILCSRSADITIYGNYFPLHSMAWRFPGRFRPRIAADRMAVIYARHIGSINVHGSVVKGGTNMRTFECAGYRIAQIVERLPGVEALFTPGEDMLTFESPEELMDQMKRLEKDSKLARSLAESAARRARAEHTYFHRARALLHDLVDVSEDAVTRLAEL